MTLEKMQQDCNQLVYSSSPLTIEYDDTNGIPPLKVSYMTLKAISQFFRKTAAPEQDSCLKPVLL
jgi:hypothetical protein